MAELEREEMLEILRAIARDGSDTARIAAIKTLLQIEESPVEDDELERLIRRK